MSDDIAPGYYLASYMGGDEIIEVFRSDTGPFVLRIGRDAEYPFDAFRIICAIGIVEAPVHER
jgi:predicted amidohydrolase